MIPTVKWWWQVLTHPIDFRVVINGVVVTSDPVTWGPFTNCRLAGSSFTDCVVLVTAPSKDLARKKVEVGMPRGLTVTGVKREWRRPVVGR